MNPFEEIGAFAPETPVAREVEFEGKTSTLWFEQCSYADFMAKIVNPAVEEGQRKELVVLANVVCLSADGRQRATYDQMRRLKREFVEVLLKHAYAVNGVGEEETKN